MVVWNPPVERVRLRNAKVASVSGSAATITMDDGRNIPNVPVYGSVAAGQGVAVLEQGGSLLVLGLRFLPLAGGTLTGNLTTGSDVYINSMGICYPGATIGGGGAHRVGFRWTNHSQIVGTVDNVVATVVGQVSSGRYKADVRALDSAVEAVQALRPVTYTPQDLDGVERVEAGRHIGLIAEEVVEALPSAVLTDDDGQPLSVNYLEIVPLLVAAVQEQQEQIDALRAALETGGA